jgi:Golgi nucleoside diphosphatase
MIKTPVDGFDSSYVRKYLIVYSDFRIQNQVEFWQNTDGTWSHLTHLSSLEAIQEYLESQYEDVG